MPEKDLSDTQPTRLQKKPGRSPSDESLKPIGAGRRRLSKIGWVLIYILLLSLTVTIAVAAGIRSGNQARIEKQSGLASLSLEEQYKLGLQDMATGSYDIARQRFEYILSQDPNYPEITERLAEVMGVLYATSPPTAAPTVAPTPTPDPRPLEERFQQASQLIDAQNWDGAIEILLALRGTDRTFMVTRVDGMLYLSLRNRGVDKILKESNLQGGTYDLALAENFAPIDVDANQARNWARLYMYGLSFWEIDPEKAVFYFSQVATAAPYLSDSSGWTATDRYRAALIQYGDLLAQQSDWCNAQAQYELAFSIRSDPQLEATIKELVVLCQGPTFSPTIGTETPTSTTTGTAPISSPSSTSTQTVPVSPTSTATLGPPSTTQAVSTPTATSPQPPQDTPYPQPMVNYEEATIDPFASPLEDGVPELVDWIAGILVNIQTWLRHWL